MNTPANETRGVYHLPWVGPSNQQYYAAVNRFGRRLYVAEVMAGQDPAEVVDLLWRKLDHDDPETTLRLVS